MEISEPENYSAAKFGCAW